MWQLPHSAEVLMCGVSRGVIPSAFFIGSSVGFSYGPLVTSGASSLNLPVNVSGLPRSSFEMR